MHMLLKIFAEPVKGTEFWIACLLCNILHSFIQAISIHSFIHSFWPFL